MLFLNIAESTLTKKLQVEFVRAFPSVIVRLGTEGLYVLRATRKWKHRNRLTHPNAIFLQPFLEAFYFCGLISCGFNQVRLHPWNMLACLYQQRFDPIGSVLAVFVQIFAAFFGDGLNAALE